MADDIPLSSASNRQFSSFQASSILPGYGVPPSVYPTDSVKDAAEGLGINNLKESVAAALASDVECRIRELVQDASKYMRHAKRDQLKTTDIDLAMRAKNIEPLYGFLPTSSGRSAPSVQSYPSAAGPSFRRAQTATGVVHYLEDDEIDFEKVLKAGPKLKPGKGVGWAAHWLAIEGVQPAVPQNPLPPGTGTTASQGAEAEKATSDADPAPTAAATAPRSLTGGAMAPLAVGASKPGQAQVKPLIKHVLSRELQLYYERLTQAILSPPESADEVEEDEEAGRGGDAAAATTAAAGDASQRKDADGDVSMSGAPSTTTALSAQPPSATPKLRSNNTVRSAALASLKGDPGLHQLVPYLVQWIAESVTNHLRNTHVLGLMLLVSDALCGNEAIFVEPYLHQLLPSVLSILLTSSLGNTTSPQAATTKSPSGPSPLTLRTHAAALLSHILRTYAPSYPNLKQRVVRTLVKALDAGCGSRALASVGGEEKEGGEASGTGPRESPGTKLGALIGLRSIGTGATALLVRPDREMTRAGEESTPTHEDKTPLGRLGGWCHRWNEVKGGAQLELVDREVVAILCALGESGIIGADGPEGAKVEGEGGASEVRIKFGAYWDGKICSESESGSASGSGGNEEVIKRAREVLRNVVL